MKLTKSLLASQLVYAQDCDLAEDPRQYDLYGCVVKRKVVSPFFVAQSHLPELIIPWRKRAHFRESDFDNHTMCLV